jgi:hypothetical protein
MPPQEMHANYLKMTKFKSATSLRSMAHNMEFLKLYRHRDATETHKKLKISFHEELGTFAAKIESLKYEETPSYTEILIHLK